MNQYLNLAREQKKLEDYEVMMIPIVVNTFRTVSEGFKKKLNNMWSVEESIMLRRCWDSSEYLKVAGDLSKLAITQIPGKDHQLILVWKTRMNKK